MIKNDQNLTKNGHFDPFLTTFWPLFGQLPIHYWSRPTALLGTFGQDLQKGGPKRGPKNGPKPQNGWFWTPSISTLTKNRKFGRVYFWGPQKWRFFHFFSTYFLAKHLCLSCKKAKKGVPKPWKKVGVIFLKSTRFESLLVKQHVKGIYEIKRGEKRGPKNGSKNDPFFEKKVKKGPFLTPFFHPFAPDSLWKWPLFEK